MKLVKALTILSIASLLILAAAIPVAHKADKLGSQGYFEADRISDLARRRSAPRSDYGRSDFVFDENWESKLRERTAADNRIAYARQAAISSYEGDLSDLHTAVTAVSLPYFVFAAVVMILVSLRPALSKRGKITLRIISAGSMLMAAWSCMLNGRINFSEVVPAWLAAALIIGITSMIVRRKCSAPSSVAAAAPLEPSLG